MIKSLGIGASLEKPSVYRLRKQLVAVHSVRRRLLGSSTTRTVRRPIVRTTVRTTARTTSATTRRSARRCWVFGSFGGGYFSVKEKVWPTCGDKGDLSHGAD